MAEQPRPEPSSFAELNADVSLLVASASQYFQTNAGHSISDESGRTHTSRPHYLHDLSIEIQKVHALSENGQRLFPSLNTFDGPETEKTLTMIAAVSEIIREMQSWLDAFGGRQDGYVEVLAPPEHTCRSYCESLVELRNSLGESMNFLQFETIRRVSLCTQPPEAIQFCQELQKEWKGGVELVCISNPSSNLEESPTNYSILGMHGGEKYSVNSFRASARRIPAGTCRQGCKCKCHKTRPRECPSKFERTVKAVFPRAAGISYMVRRCSQLECRKRSAFQGYVTLVLRSYFLNIAILISMVTRGLKFNVKIKSYPIVRESSEVVRFVQLGNVDGLKRIISCHQASPNSTSEDGWTLLHTATFGGRKEIVHFLLSQNVDTEVEDIKSRKASHLAKFKALMVTASEDDKETSEWFPYQKNFRYDFDLTPILTAVLREYDDSDTDRPDLTTLLDVSKTLDATGLDEDWWAWKRNFRDRSPLFQELITFFQHTGTGAAMETSRLQQLLEQPDCLQKWTPLLWAAFIGRLTDFIQLVELGADLFAITPSGRNVASHATECCSHEILSWLCEHKYHERGLDLSLPDLWGETPLHIAAAKSLPCTKVLLENGASVESRQVEGMTPLHYVRYLKGGERFNVVRTLLDHGSDPNAREEGGRTPMFYCLDTVDSVELLLNRGADIFIRDIEGQSILHYACIQDYPLLLSALLSRCPRALMTATDNKGDSPLLTCFQDKHSRVNCARILLERCPITWAIDRNGLTLLHHAVRMGDPMVLRFVLLMPGVDLHAKTPQGQTAEDISKEKGTWGGEIGEMLSAATEKHWQSS